MRIGILFILINFTFSAFAQDTIIYCQANAKSYCSYQLIRKSKEDSKGTFQKEVRMEDGRQWKGEGTFYKIKQGYMLHYWFIDSAPTFHPTIANQAGDSIYFSWSDNGQAQKYFQIKVGNLSYQASNFRLSMSKRSLDQDTLTLVSQSGIEIVKFGKPSAIVVSLAICANSTGYVILDQPHEEVIRIVKQGISVKKGLETIPFIRCTEVSVPATGIE